MKWIYCLQIYIKDFHKGFKESNKFISVIAITSILIAVAQINSMHNTMCQGRI